MLISLPLGRRGFFPSFFFHFIASVQTLSVDQPVCDEELEVFDIISKLQTKD